MSETPRLVTDRLVLRAPQAADVAPWTAFYASDRAATLGGPADAGRAWRVFAALVGHWTLRGCGPFVLERRAGGQSIGDPSIGGEAIGAVGPWRPDDWPESEISWSIWRADAEGQGFAAEAAQAVLAHVYGALGWATAVSYVDADNARSIRLAERLGARRDPDARRPGDDRSVLVFRHAGPSDARTPYAGLAAS